LSTRRVACDIDAAQQPWAREARNAVSDQIDGSLPKRLREAWMKTVGAFATDDNGTQSLLQRLVDFGQLSAEEAKRALADARQKIDANKAELDRRVDDSIKRFSEGRDARRLEERIVELEKKLTDLERLS
jgi:polyhydroxyalkanoate synthesis regulator phasin